MKTLVVGAGITGLLQAWKFSSKENDVIIIEKENLIGGQIRTISYNYNDNLYYFDIGPHVPPRNNEIWQYLVSKVKSDQIPLPITSAFRINSKTELMFPLSLKQLFHWNQLWFLFKFLPSYIFALIIKKREKSLKESMRNLWGSYFSKNYLKVFMENFWKNEVEVISNQFRGRISPPKLKILIKSIFTKKKSNKTIDINQNDNFIYPKYGIGQVIPVLKRILDNKKVDIKLNSEISEIKLVEQKYHVNYISNEKEIADIFDKIIWTGSIKDLNAILKLGSFHFEYNNLLTMNLIIDKPKLLEGKIHTSYVLRKGITFHRIYEPKKFSKDMVPEGKTSVCIEYTFKEDFQINDNFISNIIDQFSELFVIDRLKIHFLGHNIIKNVYPILFVNFQEEFQSFQRELKNKYSNIELLGRLGEYYPYNLNFPLQTVKLDELEKID